MSLRERARESESVCVRRCYTLSHALRRSFPSDLKETLGGGHSTAHIGTRASSDDDDCCCWLAGSSSQAWVRCSVTRTRIPTVGSRWNSYHIPAHVTNREEEGELRSKSPISPFSFSSPTRHRDPCCCCCRSRGISSVLDTSDLSSPPPPPTYQMPAAGCRRI